MYYVYSLKCNNGYYVGCCEDLGKRLERHKNGYVPATADRLPISLAFYFAIPDKYKAFEFEKYLESGSGRGIYKQAFNLIAETVPMLSHKACHKNKTTVR